MGMSKKHSGRPLQANDVDRPRATKPALTYLLCLPKPIYNNTKCKHVVKMYSTYVQHCALWVFNITEKLVDKYPTNMHTL